MVPAKKLVYLFDEIGNEDVPDGVTALRDLFGSKGANLAAMASLDLPIAAGFTITSEVCAHYYANGLRYPPELKAQIIDALTALEKARDSRFGDPVNPLLLSVRSGARSSMPGMTETILNIGLTSTTIPGMIAKTRNPRFVYDEYRRLIMMYADIVMEKAAGLEPEEGQSIRVQLEHLMEALKSSRGYKSNEDITSEELEGLCECFKARILDVLCMDFPDTPSAQLWGTIGAAFQAWNGERASSYRKTESIPDSWGTAVIVQSMVFGNMGEDCAAGVAFTRHPATGENAMFGEWLINSRGADVVAGIRIPNAINQESRNDFNSNLPTLEETLPQLYRELLDIRCKLEQHYRDAQDVDFTIQQGQLFVQETRVSKRSHAAAVRIAVEMVGEGLIDEATAVSCIKPRQVETLLRPVFDPETPRTCLCRGLHVYPGDAVGRIAFSENEALRRSGAGEKVILAINRNCEGTPDCLGNPLRLAPIQGLLVQGGGMTCLAAFLGRGARKPTVAVYKGIELHRESRLLRIGGRILGSDDWISIRGKTGEVFDGALPLIQPPFGEQLKTFLHWQSKLAVPASL